MAAKLQQVRFVVATLETGSLQMVKLQWTTTIDIQSLKSATKGSSSDDNSSEYQRIARQGVDQ